MFQVLVFLKAGDGGIDALEKYEQTILPIFEEYGGNFISAFRPAPSEAPNQPDEIHLISFPSRANFIAYREDDRILALADVRNAAIAQTTMYVADTILDYANQL